MVRLTGVLLAAAVLAIPSSLPAAEDDFAGNWKVVLLGQAQRTYWLIRLDGRGGQWSGVILDRSRRVPDTTVDDVRVSAEGVHFTLTFGDQKVHFEGTLPKGEPKTAFGSVDLDGDLVPARLEATRMRSFDDINKEILSRKARGTEVFEAALDLLGHAAEKKYQPDEIRAWAGKAFEAAAAYGPAWQREIGLRITTALADQEGFGPEATDYARRTEQLLTGNTAAKAQLRILDALAAALRSAGQPREAAALEARVDKLEAPADRDYFRKVPPLKTVPFQGRKEKSDRAVLVELFTGAQCPPCRAADLAFDALETTYKPADVVLLEYHLHVPGPDPLTNPYTQARSEYYEKEVDGTPAILFNGKPGAEGGGSVADASAKYREYRDVIDRLLEKPTNVTIQTKVSRKGQKLDISAEVSGLEATGNTTRLRLALVEEEIRYVGGNGIRFHHRVVRAMPGGPNGFALPDKTAKHSVSIDLADLRKKLGQYLTEGEHKEALARGPKPLALKRLSLVVFVQDDRTKEVLQAAQVEVPAEEAAR
jgi:hypothetical protein